MSLDTTLFHLVNRDLANPVFDLVLPVMSELAPFVPFAILLVLWMLFRDGRHGRVTVLALLLLVPLADQTASSVLKPLVDRPRPCHAEADLTDVIVRGHCGSGRSFPSSHATNMAAVAVLLGARYRRWAIPAGLFAFLVGLSRIYLGVHYPGDVVGGWILGALLGAGVALGASRLEEFWNRKRPLPLTKAG